MSLILAAGPWMAGDDATYPNRIVLRRADVRSGQVVVHQEIDPSRDGRPHFFGSGDYFPVEELERAIARFAERVRADAKYPQDGARAVTT